MNTRTPAIWTPGDWNAFFGRPGGKAMGGRIGYSAATGIAVIVLSTCGIISGSPR